MVENHHPLLRQHKRLAGIFCPSMRRRGELWTQVPLTGFNHENAV